MTLAAWVQREHQRPASCQVLPKGADFRQFTQRDLDTNAKLMNNRPRKTLGWKTLAQALAEEIAKATASVAFGT